MELDGVNIYAPDQRANEVRRQIGMVFQRPNPFPAMSIYDNVLWRVFASLAPRWRIVMDSVEESLARAGLWTEVRDRLKDLGGALSGGQQQRLCIARALAVKPKILLMDEPCSALDPASTNRIERTIEEIASDVTVVIVTHNMQQAQRVSHTCAFFLAAENQPGPDHRVRGTDADFRRSEGPENDGLRPRQVRLKPRAFGGPTVGTRAVASRYLCLGALDLVASPPVPPPRRSRDLGDGSSYAAWPSTSGRPGAEPVRRHRQLSTPSSVLGLNDFAQYPG